MAYWDTLTREDILTKPIPVHELLPNSLYYPSSGFDGSVIKDCNTLAKDLGIFSFVYCDFARGEDELLREQQTMYGYQVFASRHVEKDELTPGGCVPLDLPPNFDPDQYTRFKHLWKSFAHWTVYERKAELSENHGPKRFSLLHIGGEGVATYQALYYSNKTTAKILAIIQDGHGYGLNWTSFVDVEGPLYWVINNNPYGMPEYIYYGGVGKDDKAYKILGWPGFIRERVIGMFYAEPATYCWVGFWKR